MLRQRRARAEAASELGLYKILFCCKDVVHESMIFCANTPFGWAPHLIPLPPTRLRDILFPPDTSSLQYIPYNIGNGNIM